MCFLFSQGDIQAKYDSIDKDTPIPTDRQVDISFQTQLWPFSFLKYFNGLQLHVSIMSVFMCTD